MFEKVPDFFAVEEINIDFDFMEYFMVDVNNEVAWVRMAEEPPNPELQVMHIVRFIPTNEISNHLQEESERLLGDDQRYREDKIRDEQIISLGDSGESIIGNLGGLAASAENVAVANIDWDVRQPFTLLKYIFESITNGWKETLVTGFRDRQLRIEVFKNFSMKMEMSICRSNNLLEATINGGWETTELVLPFW
jgi:hypothetical protein